jgi:L-ascorbate metabolism protein UlaG (beta-lactamase superfamily)
VVLLKLEVLKVCSVKTMRNFIVVFFTVFSFVFQVASQQTLPVDTPKPHAVSWWFSSGFENNSHETHSYLGINGVNHLSTSIPIFLKTMFAWEPYFEHEHQLDDWVADGKPPAVSNDLCITWIGHSTFLIQIGGVNIITDPVFGALNKIMYPRKTPCGVAFIDLPKIHVVLISHNHRDHTDKKSLRMLQKRDNPLCLVPTGCSELIRSFGFSEIEELNWWDSYHYSNNAKLSFLPAWHWSGRALYDENTSLWGSWMIQAQGRTIYFAGDSAYHPDFYKVIAAAYSSIDVAMMPIGPNEPRKYMRDEHMSAEEAGQAFVDLNAKIFIPMHWGTFRLGPDKFIDPINRLNKWWQDHNLPVQKNKTLRLVKLGEQVFVNQ